MWLERNQFSSNRAARSLHLPRKSRGLAQTVPGAQGRELCLLPSSEATAAASFPPLSGSLPEAVLWEGPGSVNARDFWSGYTVDKISFSRRHSYTNRVHGALGTSSSREARDRFLVKGRYSGRVSDLNALGGETGNLRTCEAIRWKRK